LAVDPACIIFVVTSTDICQWQVDHVYCR